MTVRFRSFLFPTLASFILAWPLVAPAQEPPVELGRLIRQALEDQKSGLLDWSFLSREESPVTWLTEGIDFKDYTRRGIVLAAVDGFIPEILQRNVTVQPWSVELSGSKLGIATIQFSNDGCFGTTSLSPDCASKIVKVPESLALSNVGMDKVCEFGPGAAHSEVYRIAVANAPPAYLHLQTGGGSGGMFIDVKVILKLATPPDVAMIEHDSAVCGLLFAAHNGPDGFPAWDYRQRIE